MRLLFMCRWIEVNIANLLGSIQNGSETDQMWILVPVLPWIPSFAFSRSVIIAVRSGLEEAKSMAACTLGSMEPGAN